LGPPPFAGNGFVTFVSLNDPGKVTESVMELWARILTQVAGSRLILHISSQPSRISGIETFFSARGIDASRLTMLPRQSLDQYLAVYSHADIALDTWPCNGGTTTCDAMWMGVPVVTLSGGGSFSRTGISLLNSVGLSELAADTPDSYVAKAVGLAQNRSGLAALRANLRRHMRTSPLTNASQFARDIEAAFLGMWARYTDDRGENSA
jgi:predicted O-linked N-acetylglucosamine transferase (SPINDLY family)